MFVATDHLHALVQQAVDHALPTAGEGFHVFVMTLGAGGPNLTRFMTSAADGIEAARKHVSRNRGEIERFAIAYDGAFTLDGVRNEAVLIEAGERGSKAAGRYGIRYRPKAGDVGPTALGDKVLLETIANPLVSTEATIVTCVKCHAKNRVSIARLATAKARCGSCKDVLAL